MSQVIKTVRVENNDTLSRIARQNRVSLEALLAVNPQIRNPDLLPVGDQILVPADEFALTVRFINSWHLPPVGTRYEIIVDDALLAMGKVRLFDNEADIAVADGATVEVRAQRIGDSDLHQVPASSPTVRKRSSWYVSMSANSVNRTRLERIRSR